MSELTLGERDSWRDTGRDNVPCADEGRDSGNCDAFESIEVDLRWAYERWGSVARAAAAAIPPPPLPLAFLFARVASSNRSRFRLGDFGAL